VSKNLVFAGTERGVYVSFDGGDHWQSLRQNLPATSVRDLVVHGNDVVAGTHGRAFWIMDDIAPLREISLNFANSGRSLMRPAEAIRFRRSTNTDTPLPPEEPHGQNPPDGAIIDYVVPQSGGAVTLEILDSSGKVVRRYSSADQPQPIDPKELNVPMYWVRMPHVLPSTPGMHRWVWDLRYETPKSIARGFPISAIPHDTPREPLGPRALPGQYTVRLTAGGKTETQPLTVKMDPRVTTPAADLKQMFELEQRLAAIMDATYDQARQAGAEPGGEGEAPRGGRNPFAQINAGAAGLFATIDSADAAPTTQAVSAIEELERRLQQVKSANVKP
jgi:hypothetical protein